MEETTVEDRERTVDIDELGSSPPAMTPRS
jgi:hypothetical protein